MVGAVSRIKVVTAVRTQTETIRYCITVFDREKQCRTSISIGRTQLSTDDSRSFVNLCRNAGTSYRRIVGTMNGNLDVCLIGSTVLIRYTDRNIDNLDPEVPLSCINTEPVERNVDTVLSNSFGFGGHNSSLILRKFKD